MITIGSDPEAFIYSHKEKRIISVENLIKKKGKGTKENPLSIGNGCKIQEDNALIEWNTKPVTNLKDWLEIQHYCMENINAILGDHYELSIDSSNEMNPYDLSTEQCKTAGCEAEFSAWALDIIDPPDLENSNLRSAGGHIHIGMDLSEKEAINLTKVMDKYLGIPSLRMDTDLQRRELYGKAGSFRLTDYGIEYRTLSNFWLKSDDLIKWAFNKTMLAIENINEEINPEVETIINTNNIEKCVEYSDI